MDVSGESAPVRRQQLVYDTRQAAAAAAAAQVLRETDSSAKHAPVRREQLVFETRESAAYAAVGTARVADKTKMERAPDRRITADAYATETSNVTGAAVPNESLWTDTERGRPDNPNTGLSGADFGPRMRATMGTYDKDAIQRLIDSREMEGRIAAGMSAVPHDPDNRDAVSGAAFSDRGDVMKARAGGASHDGGRAEDDTGGEATRRRRGLVDTAGSIQHGTTAVETMPVLGDTTRTGTVVTCEATNDLTIAREQLKDNPLVQNFSGA